jgi:hypothetical protein
LFCWDDCPILSYQTLVVSVKALKSAWSVCSGVCSTLTSTGFADDLFVEKCHLAEQQQCPLHTSHPPHLGRTTCAAFPKKMTRGPSLPRCTRAERDQYWMDLGFAKSLFIGLQVHLFWQLDLRVKWHGIWCTTHRCVVREYFGGTE